MTPYRRLLWLGALAGVTLALMDDPDARRDSLSVDLDGVPVPVTVALDQVGVRVRTGVSLSAIESRLGLSVLRQCPGGLLILQLPRPLRGAELAQRARDLRREGGDLLVEVGLVGTPRGSKAPVLVESNALSITVASLGAAAVP